MASTRDTSRSSLLKAAAQYSVGSILGIVGSVLRVGLAARLLTTDLNGLWLGLQLLFSYASNLHLGVLFGMFRNVPMLRGAGDNGGADAIKRTTLTFLSAVGVLTALIWVAASLTLATSGDHRRYLIETGALTVMTLFRSYYTIAYKSESRFAELSIASAVGSVVSVATVGLIWLFQLDGLIAGMFAQGLIEVALLARRERWLGFAFDFRILRGLIAVGALTLLISVGTTLLTSVDRTVMLQRLGANSTGLYYIGANIVVLLPTLAGLPANVLTPRFFERYGKSGNPAELLSLVDVPVRVASVWLAALLGSAAIALPTIIAHVWPRLAEGAFAARLALLTTFPLVIAGLVTNVFYTLNRQFTQLVLLALASGLSYGAATAAVRMSPNIDAACAGSLVGTFGYLVAVVLLAYAYMTGKAAGGLPLLLRSLLPLAVSLAAVLLLDLVGSRFAPATSLGRTVVEEAAFLLMASPPLMAAWKMLLGTSGGLSSDRSSASTPAGRGK